MSAELVKLLLNRTVNQLNCLMSYAQSLFGIVHVRHMPTFVSIEPANFCQLRCPECPVGMAEGHPFEPKRMKEEVWENILPQLKNTVHTIQFFFQGEPLLNPLLPDMIADAHREGIYTIVSTNAQALTSNMAESFVRSGLDRIIISLDGLTNDSYNAYRIGGSVNKVIQGMSFLQDMKQKYNVRHPFVELQCLRLKTNEQDWPTLQKQYKQLGADRLVFKTAQFYDYEQGNPLMPSDERFSRYKKDKNGTYCLKQSFFRRAWAYLGITPCWRLWSGCVITTEGEVLPCCFDKGHQFYLGKMDEQHSLQDIFLSDEANKFRERALKNLPSICHNCTH